MVGESSSNDVATEEDLEQDPCVSRFKNVAVVECESIFVIWFCLKDVLSAENISEFPRENESPKNPLSCGLENLGNTCYMNSVLQCLFRSNSFLDFLHQVPHSPNSLSILLLELLNKMIKSKTASPKMFFKDFKVIRPQFAGGNQEDCQEFLISLLQSLDDEISPNAQLKNMFGVTVISTLTCKSCSNQSSSVENT